MNIAAPNKPDGKVTAVSFAQRRPANDKAVFVNIVCKDEAGNVWHFSSACFCFELKPGEPPEAKPPEQQKIPDGWCPICGGKDGEHKPGCADGSEIL